MDHESLNFSRKILKTNKKHTWKNLIFHWKYEIKIIHIDNIYEFIFLIKKFVFFFFFFFFLINDFQKANVSEATCRDS